MQLYNLINMWYTKNLIKTAQQNLTINDVSAELRKHFPNLTGVVTGDNNNYSILLSDGKTLEGTLPELIKQGQNKDTANKYKFAIDLLNSDINNFNTKYNADFPTFRYQADGYIVPLKPFPGDGPNASYTLELAREKLNKLKSEKTSSAINPASQQSPNQPNQELVLLSPVSNGVAELQLPEELLNQYNEARNSGSIIKFQVTKNQNGTNQIAVKEASQYYTQHQKLLEAIRLFLEKNGKFQFATDDAGNVIPGEYFLYQAGEVKPANYQPAKLNILVPGAADKAPVDLFLDGQKIATVYNNTDFTFDTTKYPLLEGKHVLEAKAEKVPSLTPIQDKFLKTLSKNRSYYFNIEEGKMPNLTTSTNDLSTYKAADSESYGSGLAVKLRENPYRSPQRDLQENNVAGLNPAFKRYYIVKTRISDNDPETRANIVTRAVDLQNAIVNSKSLTPYEYEDYVTAILSVEGPGQIASDTQLNAIINKIQVERAPAAPAG